MHGPLDRLMHWQLIFLVQVRLRTVVYAPQAQATYDLQIMTVHFVSLYTPMAVVIDNNLPI